MSSPPGEARSHDLTSRVGAMARRFADHVESACPESAERDDTVAWLRAWADRVTVDVTPGEPVPIDELARRLGLSGAEVDLVLLAGLPEEHHGLADACRRCHPRGEPNPTVELVQEITRRDTPDDAMMRRLLLEGPAARAGVLELSGGEPFAERSLTLASGLWGALHGHDAWPPGLARVLVGDPPAGLDGWLDLPEVQRARALLATEESVSLVLGASGTAIGLSRAAALAGAAGTRVVAARVETAADVRRLVAHAAARSALPLLVVPGPTATAAETAGARPVPPAPDLTGVRGPVLVCAPPGSFVPDAERAALTVPTGPIGVADRRAAWRAALPGDGHLAPALAARHPLDPALTAQVSLDLAARGAERPTLAEVSAVIRARAGAALPPGVELRTPDPRGRRPILDPAATMLLHDAVQRLELQATVLDDWDLQRRAGADRGVRLLFTGPPGTGKTLAAHGVAADAGTDLLVVDVSRVVSKWLGETEKNLAAAFETAERTQAVLLLDEADVLFATRTEVGDAQDRYANLETAYLLQRLDHFDGLTVLATNLRQNIDAAFLRRIDFVVEFERPDTATRRALWEQHLPLDRLAGAVDLDHLARRFDVTGSTIRNAAVDAVYLAAAEDPDGAVTADHLITALRREYAKDHRPFPVLAEPTAVARDARAAEVLAAHARRTAPARPGP
ncbi:ATP-binding protein [Actinomycetospora lemnae]|uniref:ATP-binding protein n=1 Tax=Actinomycetospora lemnae TaxID=3019891 RepID=A0ABT5SUS7_9PSEU|nr:ATP-binding protein [Actinomycetospora sp. DW7H6]MDD7965493.1 ATP-binding protein [Actinomycetospora sp. DW7H6]